MWRALMPKAELWEAEANAQCVRAHDKALREVGIRPLVGSQGNRTTVRSWVTASGGDFDVIVDDGSHVDHDIFVSFAVLWPHVKPGGLYFIEDLGSALAPKAADVFAAWAQAKARIMPSASEQFIHGMRISRPVDIAFINFFDNAVVIGKDRNHARHVSTGRGNQCSPSKKSDGLHSIVASIIG